eukprot:TRINITY_DN957_c0_g1_i1.p1 TRINITY_DN957_c0_g1~~TRINITY_DN957_c0_g1_i1.p1  ORF type:complete len:120 (+),score=34.40 TRINITY_DN957_c0_g1_i1:47-406(+)
MTLKHKKGKMELHDRHSKTGKLGLPKKNGAGAKYVWGTLDVQEGPLYLDEHDVNYVKPGEPLVESHLFYEEEDDVEGFLGGEEEQQSLSSHEEYHDSNDEQIEQEASPRHAIEESIPVR